MNGKGKVRLQEQMRFFLNLCVEEIKNGNFNYKKRKKKSGNRSYRNFIRIGWSNIIIKFRGANIGKTYEKL